MTAIAYRDGILAADSVAWCGDVAVPVIKKIARLPDGTLIAVAGDTAVCRWFKEEWPNLRNSDSPTIKEGELNALIVMSSGTVLECDHHLRPFEVIGPFHALGAPHRFMAGAMHAGASAEEAVRLAILHTDGAGGEVQVEHLHPALAEAAD